MTPSFSGPSSCRLVDCDLDEAGACELAVVIERLPLLASLSYAVLRGRPGLVTMLKLNPGGPRRNTRLSRNKFGPVGARALATAFQACLRLNTIEYTPPRVAAVTRGLSL